MSLLDFITYAAYIVGLCFAYFFIRAMFAWLNRTEANTTAKIAHANLEDAQAQQIRSRLHHFEVHGGILFFYDGEDHGEPPIPYIKVGPVTESDAPTAPEPVANPDLVTAKKLVDLSLAKFSGSGNQLIPYEGSGLDHNAHSSAVKWLASQGMVLPTNNGVFTRDTTLSGLSRWLLLAEAVSKLPPAQRTGIT